MTRTIATAWMLVVALAASAAAQPAATLAERTKGLSCLDGFVPLYWDAARGRVLAEVPVFDSDVLYYVSAASGAGSVELPFDRGILGTEVIHFQRSGPRVLVVAQNQRYRAVGGTPAGGSPGGIRGVRPVAQIGAVATNALGEASGMGRLHDALHSVFLAHHARAQLGAQPIGSQRLGRVQQEARHAGGHTEGGIGLVGVDACAARRVEAPRRRAHLFVEPYCFSRECPVRHIALRQRQDDPLRLGREQRGIGGISRPARVADHVRMQRPRRVVAAHGWHRDDVEERQEARVALAQLVEHLAGQLAHHAYAAIVHEGLHAGRQVHEAAGLVAEEVREVVEVEDGVQPRSRLQHATQTLLPLPEAALPGDQLRPGRGPHQPLGVPPHAAQPAAEDGALAAALGPPQVCGHG